MGKLGGRLDDDEKVLLKREEYENVSDPKPDLGSEFDRQKGAKSKWFVNVLFSKVS